MTVISGKAQSQPRRRLWQRGFAPAVALLAPLLIILVGVLLYQQVITANRLAAAEKAALERRTLVLSVLSALQDVETGSRGYVITGNPAFLKPYHDAVRTLTEVRPALDRAYADIAEAQSDLTAIDRLSKERSAAAARSIALRSTGRPGEAAEWVAHGPGKAVMDAIRGHIHVLTTNETRDLARVSAASARALSISRATTFGLLGLLLALLVAATIAIQRSMVARDQALADLSDISRRRQAILDGATDTIITLNPSGSIESANAAAAHMFGYDPEELDRRDMGMLFAEPMPPGRVAELLRDISPESGGAAHEIAARRRDGSQFPVEVAISTLELAVGRRYVAVMRDVTERKRVEQLKGEFVSTVSHELRTPLSSIAGSLGLLAGGAAGPLGAKAERLIAIAHKNADRLVRLINDILDIEKIESGKVVFHDKELDLVTALSDSIDENQSFAERFSVNLRLETALDSAWVCADPDRLAQVITNLLSNAIKFSPSGGTVRVTLAPGELGHRISIVDEGAGIPESFRDRIFGKFAQADASDSRQKGGTGLGLSIVQQIVKRLGGRVSYESEVGQGTAFHVDLPALNARCSRPAQPILLVCGNGAGTTFTGALRRAGYEVRLVREAAEAAAALQDTHFDGVIVDMGLKRGEGIEIIRLVREADETVQIPILALGGRPGTSELDGDAALVLDWLRKPAEIDRLRGSIDATARALEGARPRVLHVEDDPDIARLVAEALADSADIVAARTLAAARSALAAEQFDLAIIDLGLADGDGFELVAAMRRQGERPIPVVIFSAQDADPHMAGQVDAFLTKARTPIGSLVDVVGSLTAPPTVTEVQD